MYSADHVIFVLQLIVTLGPLAVYFLGLGLVSSQARPCLVRASVDFVLLAVAFLPVIIAPVLGLLMHGNYWIAGAVVAAVAALFWTLLPKDASAWVIYNIDRREFVRLLERSCRRLGWSVAEQDEQLHVSPVQLTVRHEGLPWLRSVTLRIHANSDEGRAEADRLICAIGAEMERLSMLPSPAGASLVIIGASLLGVPMWYVFRHMDAIVDVVRQMLPA